MVKSRVELIQSPSLQRGYFKIIWLSFTALNLKSQSRHLWALVLLDEKPGGTFGTEMIILYLILTDTLDIFTHIKKRKLHQPHRFLPTWFENVPSGLDDPYMRLPWSSYLKEKTLVSKFYSRTKRKLHQSWSRPNLTDAFCLQFFFIYFFEA